MSTFENYAEFYESINISRCDGQNAISEKQTPLLQYHKNLETRIWELTFLLGFRKVTKEEQNANTIRCETELTYWSCA